MPFLSFIIPLIFMFLGYHFHVMVVSGIVGLLSYFLESWVLSIFLRWVGICYVFCSYICSFQVIVYIWDTFSSILLCGVHAIDANDTFGGVSSSISGISIFYFFALTCSNLIYFVHCGWWVDLLTYFC